MSKENTGSENQKDAAVTLKEIQELAIKRQEAWERAHELSMELHLAIEASGISPTKIAAAAPISRVAIYSLKKQMKARIKREQGESEGKN